MRAEDVELAERAEQRRREEEEWGYEEEEVEEDVYEGRGRGGGGGGGKLLGKGGVLARGGQRVRKSAERLAYVREQGWDDLSDGGEGTIVSRLPESTPKFIPKSHQNCNFCEGRVCSAVFANFPRHARQRDTCIPSLFRSRRSLALRIGPVSLLPLDASVAKTCIRKGAPPPPPVFFALFSRPNNNQS
jgi:hypothetical protein